MLDAASSQHEVKRIRDGDHCTNPNQFFHDLDDPSRGIECFALLGLLSNYNKFEFANPYRLRQEDFVNEAALTNVIHSIGSGFSLCRDAYIAVQDDQVEGWNPLGFLGLGVFSSTSAKAPVLSEEDMKKAFATLSVLQS